MKSLLLMRHAKSDWNASYGADHDRPLNERGERSARAIGEALAADGVAPDQVISSSAVRARTTAELAANAGRWDCDVVVDSRLYGGGADTIVSIAASDGRGDRLMLVGHEPTWSYLVSMLTGDHVEVRTATVVVIEFDVEDWSELEPGTGKVATVYQARDYTG